MNFKNNFSAAVSASEDSNFVIQLNMIVGIVHIELMTFEPVNGAGICVQIGNTCWICIFSDGSLWHRVTRSSIW